MKHVIKHDLSIDLARKAMKKAFEMYIEKFEKYSPTANWTTDNDVKIGFEARGIKIGGDVQLRPNEIEVDMSVPFLLKPFQSKAIDVVDKEINTWIGKAKAGELDEDEEA